MKHYASAGTYRTVVHVAQEIIYFRIPDVPEGRQITRVDVWVGVAFFLGSDALFDINLNGATVFSSPSDRPALSPNTTTASTSGLSVDVARGDIITVDADYVPAGGVAGPVFISLTIEDGVETAGSIAVQDESGDTEVTQVTRLIVADGDLEDQGDGVVRILTASDASGAGGSDFDIWLTDAPPASPSALNDDFRDSDIDAKWTRIYWATTGFTWDMNSTVPDALYVSDPTTSGDYCHSLMEPLPGGATDFTIATKVFHLSPDAQYQHFGLLIADDATAGAGTQATASIDISSGMKFAGYKFINYSTYDGTFYAPASLAGASDSLRVFYLRLRRSSSSYYIAYSYDGRVWREVALSSPGFTPTHVGLYDTNLTTSSALNLAWDNFRYFPVADAKLGNLVSGSFSS